MVQVASFADFTLKMILTESMTRKVLEPATKRL
jgi:hypothetical protein